MPVPVKWTVIGCIASETGENPSWARVQRALALLSLRSQFRRFHLCSQQSARKQQGLPGVGGAAFELPQVIGSIFQARGSDATTMPKNQVDH